MFGYIVINKQELKIKDFDRYKGYYCGLCESLKKKYKMSGQISLSYDMTFLVILLTGLFEPDNECKKERCGLHPVKKHTVIKNLYSDYGADMNMLLTYYKCIDDWKDEKKYGRYIYSKSIRKKLIKNGWLNNEKSRKIKENMDELSECEKRNCMDIDKMSGLFGNVLGEIFLYGKEWERELFSIGYYLGKYIYILDAYDDIVDDLKNKRYNPLVNVYGREDFDDYVKEILTIMISHCAKAFEQLPIVMDVEILRNILYCGVWQKYEAVREKRKKNERSV